MTARPTGRWIYPSEAAEILKVSVKVPGRWEVTGRSIDGEHRVYARYLGPDEDGDA